MLVEVEFMGERLGAKRYSENVDSGGKSRALEKSKK